MKLLTVCLYISVLNWWKHVETVNSVVLLFTMKQIWVHVTVQQVVSRSFPCWTRFSPSELLLLTFDLSLVFSIISVITRKFGSIFKLTGMYMVSWYYLTIWKALVDQISIMKRSWFLIWIILYQNVSSFFI